MQDKVFRRAVFAVLGVCLALTVAHLIYIVCAYRHCSIVYFIAKELW